MKKILLLLGILVSIVAASQNTVIKASENPTLLFEFNDYTFQKDELITLTIRTYNYNDLYGFQVDIKENAAVFSFPGNTDTPYLVAGDSILSGGTTWLNQVSNQIGTLIYTRDEGILTGVNFVDNSKLVEITFVAEDDIENIYDDFSVSNLYSDLEYGDKNIIIKLSDSNGDPIAYDFVIDTTAPVITNTQNYIINEGDVMPDVLNGVNVVDDYDDRELELFTDLNDIVDNNIPGVFNVNIWAFDIFGNKDLVTISFTVLDITAPVITGPSELEYIITDTAIDYLALYSVTDNSDGVIELTSVHIDESGVDYDTVGTYTAVITISDDAGNEASKDITINVVLEIDVEEIIITNSSIVIYADDEGQLTFDVLPIDAFDKSVTITTSDLTVVSINQNGEFVAHRSGTVTITITSDETGISDTIIITVLLESPVFEIKASIDTISEGDSWVNPGCTAVLFGISHDCTLESNNFENTVGTYEVVYSYENSDGLKEYFTRKIKVIEEITKGTLTLRGGIDTVKLGDEWIDTGCEEQCIVESINVDVNTEGDYRVIYSLSGDPTVTITRYVYVYDDINTNQNLAIILPRKEGDYLV